jgi:hypothetical protein
MIQKSVRKGDGKSNKKYIEYFECIIVDILNREGIRCSSESLSDK